MRYLDAFDEVFERLLSTGLKENDVIILLAKLLTDYEECFKTTKVE